MQRGTLRSLRSVLLISNLFSVGPAYGAVCKELAQKLAQAGWQVVTTSALQNRFGRIVDMLWTVWRARNQYVVAQIDVFSGSAFVWAELTTRLLTALHKPYILTLHGGNLPSFAASHPRRVRGLLAGATLVTTPSRYLLDAMRQYRDDIELLPNPIEIGVYSFQLRIKPAPRLLNLRALHKIYNPAMAVHALHSLRDNFPEAQLSIAGPDKGDGAAGELRTLINTLGLGSHVTLLGAVQKADVPQVMAQADIFVNTSNADNTPISVIEAMACGLCIVSTNVGGIPYLLTHEHNALLVAPDDATAMAEAIQRILSDPALAERLSRNARATAEGFDWATILPRWEALLEEAGSPSG